MKNATATTLPLKTGGHILILTTTGRIVAECTCQRFTAEPKTLDEARTLHASHLDFEVRTARGEA